MSFLNEIWQRDELSVYSNLEATNITISKLKNAIDNFGEFDLQLEKQFVGINDSKDNVMDIDNE